MFQMWIQLTGCDGSTLSLNSDHVICLRESGARTLVTHTRGEVLVLQSQAAIFEALSLGVMPRATVEQSLELH